MQLLKSLCCVLLLVSTAHAQSYPWSSQPTIKKLENLEGREEQLTLRLDTLHQQKTTDDSPGQKPVLNDWYNTDFITVGYGYVTPEGRPYGIWRYYQLRKGTYELFCEGYYAHLTTDNLGINKEWSQRYPTTDFSEVKKGFIADAGDAFYFTGEWRFYTNGKLQKILVLDKEAMLPLQEMVFEDGTTKLMLRTPDKKRLAGQVLTTAFFSPQGFITQINTNGLDLRFNSQGKPIIQPLYEPSFIE